MIQKFIFPLLFLLIFPLAKVEAQLNSFGLGANLGLGEIKGGSPYQSSLSGVFFISLVPALLPDIDFRIAINYTRKMEYFLPENRRNRYYPLITVYSLKGFIQQYVSETIFLEEGLGLLILNDRIFSDRNDWNYGLGLNVLGGLDLRGGMKHGFTGGIGAEFGQTFNNSQASYYSMYFQMMYYFNL